MPASASAVATTRTVRAARTPDRIAPTVRIGRREVAAHDLPAGLRVDERLGLLLHESIGGSSLYRNHFGGIYETRCEITPRGDFLLMFPDAMKNTQRGVAPNGHYGHAKAKVNRMLAIRSQDRGKSWSTPYLPFDQDFNQHGFVPLRPRSGGLYCFGTQPRWDRFNGIENAPIGWRQSDDDGLSWSPIRYIEPVNAPDYAGMSVMRMTETPRGTWILGTHSAGVWFERDGGPTTTSRQYFLRSEDQGESWTIYPDPPEGWQIAEHGRMDEARPIAVDDEVYAQIRTPTGRLWHCRSRDDGRSWSTPEPSPLVSPDAPPMLFQLQDGRLAAFHHNVCTRLGGHFNFIDRAQLWVSLSIDVGRTWSEPRFLLANAFAPNPDNQGNAFCDHQCSYIDVLAADGSVHIFMPHRWQRALHLKLRAGDLARLPTARDLGIA
jgi:hypothetical protein